MDYRKLEDLKLAGFAANVLTLLGAGTLTAIDSHIIAPSLTTSIGTLPADLETKTLNAITADDSRRAAVSEKNIVRRDLLAIMKQVRDTLLASNAPRNQWELAGFDYPDLVQTRYIAQDPTELSAFGYSNGVNSIVFRGNNKAGRVVFEIWRRHGDTVDWALHATTRRQRHTDTPVTPGQYYEYKVRAVASRSISNFSNSAVVYGAP